MRDPARAAEQSWPDVNPRFVWPPTPPQKRKRRPPTGAAPFVEARDTFGINATAASAAQRACDAAARRVASLDRRSEALGKLGYRTASLRLGAVADPMREVLT